VAKEIAHEPDARRYVMHIDGDVIAVADYAINGNQISFTHTFTNPKHRGKGLAGEVVAFAMDDVEQTTTYRVVPMCWYVADWFEAHPERRDLLERPLTV
jgi:uncharacterized protein